MKVDLLVVQKHQASGETLEPVRGGQFNLQTLVHILGTHMTLCGTGSRCSREDSARYQPLSPGRGESGAGRNSPRQPLLSTAGSAAPSAFLLEGGLHVVEDTKVSNKYACNRTEHGA